MQLTKGLFFVFCLVVIGVWGNEGTEGERKIRKAELGAYYINPDWVHVSGISAGAYFAVQFEVAHSTFVHGAGSIAGGPYYCAQSNVVTALSSCMTSPAQINVANLIRQTDSYASSGQIDPVANIRDHKNYIFAGRSDRTVSPGCSEKLLDYWLNYQNASNIVTEFDINSGHAQITDNYGSACATTAPPYINDCDYDSVGVLLQHQYGGTLKPRTTYNPDNLFAFDQYPAVSFQDIAYVYVPTACQQGARCGLHVAFHGCTQNTENFNVRLQYVEHGGYNEWAEANNIIILYPQASTSLVPNNPNACFDWWGYGGANYCTKNGEQVKAVKDMMDQLMSGGPTIGAPSGLSVVNVTDYTISLQWNAVADATGYHVQRNGAQITTNPVTQTKYTDTGLSTGTTYQYTVTTVAGGGSSAPSNVVSATTTGPPPPLASPVLRLDGTSSSTAAISWNAVSGASGYTIHRNGAEIRNTTSTTFTDTDLIPETTYVYTVNGYTSSGQAGPESNSITARTTSTWVCQTYNDNNYNHVSAGRAYQRLGYVYAVGSDEYMGLYNVAARTTLSETAQDYYIIGNCS